MKNTFSLCLIARDENEYLPEWLDYHILIGVERFYIYDNESRIPLASTLKEYIDTGRVVLHQVSGKAMQLASYDHCLQNYGSQNRWIGFIDADEFIVPKTSLDLRVFLKEYESFGGIAISSMFFGSNGHDRKPKGGQIAHYIQRTEASYPWNRLVKCIVQPQRTAFPDSAHGFTYFTPYFCVNESGQRVDTQNFPNHVDKIQLNHYFCRSQEDISEKLKRAVAGDGRLYVRQRFDEVNSFSSVEDRSIFKVIGEAAPAGFGTGWESSGDESFLMQWLHQITQDIQMPSGEGSSVIEFSLRPEFLEYNQKTKALVEAYKVKDLNTALTLTHELLATFPQKIVLLTSLANLLMYFKNLETAWKILEEAWKISPNNYEALNQLSHFFFLAGKYDEAESTLRRMLATGPDEVDTLFRLSWVLAKQNRMQEAYEIGYPLIITHGLGGEIFFDNLADLIHLLGRYLVKEGINKPARKLAKIGLKIATDDREFMDWVR